MKSGRTLETWDSWVDEAIQDARERGDFDNLPGQGQPVTIETNPLAGDNELGYHVLKNNNILPHWMELSKELAQARVDLDTFLSQSAARLTRLRERVCSGPGGDAAPEKATILRRLLFGTSPAGRDANQSFSLASVEQDRLIMRRQYLQRAANVDKRTQEYNAALSDDLRWLERPRLLPQQAEATFDATCPPVRCDNSGTV
jgi:hypothetical protein